MKKMFLAVAGMAALSSAATHAATIDFSYTFADDGLALVGSLTGDLVGDVVENISNVHIALDGHTFTGPLLLGAWDSTATGFDTAVHPVLSTVASKNNFVFSDGATPLGTDTTNWFYMTSAPDLLALGGAPVNASKPDLNGLSDSDAVLNGSWNLHVQPVPLPAAVLLFPSGLALLGALRRRRAVA